MADVTGPRVRPKPRPGVFDIVWWALLTAFCGRSFGHACWDHKSAGSITAAAAVTAVSVLFLVGTACARAAWRPSQLTADEQLARLYEQKLGGRR